MNIDLIFILGLIIISFFVWTRIVSVYIDRKPERTIAYSCLLTLIIGIVYTFSRLSIHYWFLPNSNLNHPYIFSKVLSYLSISVSVILVNILFSIIWEEKTIRWEHNHSTIETLKIILVGFMCLTSLIFAFPEWCYVQFVAPIFATGFMLIVSYVLFKHTKLNIAFEDFIFLTSHEHSEKIKNDYKVTKKNK